MEEKSGRFVITSQVRRRKSYKSNENDGDQGKGQDALGNLCVVCEKICHHFRAPSAPGEFFSHQIFRLLPPDPPSI